ncbi:hypothetical protein [Rubritepida flocculans]|uniref:hypothetical protein n=1 Tax=Rubritepida flocculans TaxID=182403 RepID=UPI000419990D|nr:hypothetical protein [Rubritepida flocculans]
MSISLVPADNRRRQFVCTGGETVFPVTFPFFAAAHLLVRRLRAAVMSELVLSTDYTVAGAGSPSGGSVTLTDPALAGDVILIWGQQPVARTAQWTDGSALTAAALNAEFARWWIALQEARREAERALRAAPTDPTTALELPPQAARAGRFLGFNAGGEPIAMAGVSPVAVSAWAATLLDDSSAAEARGTLGASTVGAQVFTAASAADARGFLGASTVGAQVFTAASAAHARAFLSAAPTPNNTVGALGQFYHQATAPGVTWSTPAGGTWAYSVRGFTTGGVCNLQFVSGVAAGGTAIINSPSIVFEGFAWRIA